MNNFGRAKGVGAVQVFKGAGGLGWQEFAGY